MALIRVHESLYNHEMFLDIIDAFDEIKEIGAEPNVKIFRVQHEEIPKEDKVICVDFYEFEGVKPFILSYDC